jgi:integrase
VAETSRTNGGKRPFRTGHTSGERALTQKEYEALISHCITNEERLLLMLAVTTGLRRVDIAKVQISNIDLAEAKLTFHEHKKDRRDKTGKVVEERWRMIPLSPKVVQELTIYLNAVGKDHGGFLFSWGEPRWGDRTAHRRFQVMCDRAGVERRPFHALRASCIKFCQAKGWSPEQVAKLTGDTIAVIQQHYLTPSDQEMHETVREKEVV